MTAPLTPEARAALRAVADWAGAWGHEADRRLRLEPETVLALLDEADEAELYRNYYVAAEQCDRRHWQVDFDAVDACRQAIEDRAALAEPRQNASVGSLERAGGTEGGKAG